jgi:hypothetical protein
MSDSNLDSTALSENGAFRDIPGTEGFWPTSQRSCKCIPPCTYATPITTVTPCTINTTTAPAKPYRIPIGFFDFLALPRELRDMIYEYVFVPSDKAEEPKGPDYSWIQTYSAYGQLKWTPIDMTILHVCIQIHNEAKEGLLRMVNNPLPGNGPIILTVDTLNPDCGHSRWGPQIAKTVLARAGITLSRISERVSTPERKDALNPLTWQCLSQNLLHISSYLLTGGPRWRTCISLRGRPRRHLGLGAFSAKVITGEVIINRPPYDKYKHSPFGFIETSRLNPSPLE